MLDITLTVTYFAFLLGFGVIIANLAKKWHLPDAFFLLLLGLVLGPTIFSNPAVTQFIDVTLVNVGAMGSVPDFLRTLALILIVFMGAFNLKFKVFKKFSSVSVNMAVVGVILNTIVLGTVAHFLFNLEWVYALLMSAVISGTGTGVVYAFEGVFKDSAKSITILKIESIFNSPLTVLVPLLFLDLVVLQPGALFEPLRYATSFWLMVAAGVGTGIIIGLAVSRLMKGMLKQYSPLLLFAIALVTYALTENVGGSGMLAVAVCGLIAGNFGVPKKEKEEIERFEDHLSEMLRISVFTLLGAQIAFTLTMHEFLVACVFFVAVFLLRPVWALPLLGKRLRSEMTRRDVLVLSFLAPRGLASAAMAPIVAAVIISAGSPVMGGFILNVIFLIILLSILLSTIAAILLREKIEAPVERLKVLPEEKLVEYEELGKKKAKPAKPKKKKPKKK